ncbi:MAG: NADH-quinone oxidoreductase subunit L [Coriobacteriia bacterium]|nr:NADH-quinone oxidoreductase subunit L [Coriobacteriia bacterium]
MSMDYVLLVPLLPALAFAVLTPMPRTVRLKLVPLAVGAVFGSLVLSIAAFLAVWPGGQQLEPAWHGVVTIAHIGDRAISLGLALEPMSAVMLLVVTIVGAAVQVYSLGYMHREERIGWYYAALSLFTAAMLVLVLSNDFLGLFMAWEVMGLCSYLLIGFWHEQEAPRLASIKAFLTTKVGDLGFMLALAVIYAEVGVFDFATVLGHDWSAGTATFVALLMLFGAMGKSAQFPLHTWLPDAMAGPTPASALIHAATMVAAGVFLIVRAFPIFEASGIALTVTLWVGLGTALLSGLLAMVQHDIKKVLAYSTISQLGFMFIALGAGSPTVALYHLVTHAYFKSLLFLGAGVIIHAAHTQDMRQMGGLARKLPVTSLTFAAGSLALAGVVPFSGFWSKDEILAVLLHEQQYAAFAIALAAAFVTAFYVARLWFRVFTAPTQQAELHEGHRSMVAPMVVLAAITAVIGFFGPTLGGFLGHGIPWPAFGTAAVSTFAAAAGIMLGWYVYGRRKSVVNTQVIKQRFPHAYGVLVNKYYFDLTYGYFIVGGYTALARGLASLDANVVDGIVNGAARTWRSLAALGWAFDRRVIDGVVNGSASAVRAAGARMRTLQTGSVRGYQTLVAGAVVLFVIWILVKGA